jgi:hypothetical protein
MSTGLEARSVELNKQQKLVKNLLHYSKNQWPLLDVKGRALHPPDTWTVPNGKEFLCDANFYTVCNISTIPNVLKYFEHQFLAQLQVRRG